MPGIDFVSEALLARRLNKRERKLRESLRMPAPSREEMMSELSPANIRALDEALVEAMVRKDQKAVEVLRTEQDRLRLLGTLLLGQIPGTGIPTTPKGEDFAAARRQPLVPMQKVEEEDRRFTDSPGVGEGEWNRERSPELEEWLARPRPARATMSRRGGVRLQ